MTEDHAGNCQSCGREDTPVHLYERVVMEGDGWADKKLCRVCRNMTGDHYERAHRAEDIWILFDLLQEARR